MRRLVRRGPCEHIEGNRETRMFQFSRSLYRELGPLVVDDRWGAATHRRQVLQSCEAAFERLGSDRHYFAQPTRKLFNDVRVHFPMRHQRRVYELIERYMSIATMYVDLREREGIGVDGIQLSCHASTRKGTACQRVPLPGSKYCPSHKHLDEDFELIEVDVEEFAFAA
jgi:hypothetical protein